MILVNGHSVWCVAVLVPLHQEITAHLTAQSLCKLVVLLIFGDQVEHIVLLAVDCGSISTISYQFVEDLWLGIRGDSCQHQWSKVHELRLIGRFVIFMDVLLLQTLLIDKYFRCFFVQAPENPHKQLTMTVIGAAADSIVDDIVFLFAGQTNMASLCQLPLLQDNL